MCNHVIGIDIEILLQMYNLCHRRWKYHGLYIAVLGYVSLSEEANIKLNVAC
jgi:hypothetical protein